ncbi:expansin EXLX1 family cellulose-binding protein [Nonomuraea sp. NPDC050310]|uniref:expansin EXLX1 family cellulose-binding protein n=1 Tax=unclassified Nonomuraea TaxID=2593643 RepID=UPI0033F34599
MGDHTRRPDWRRRGLTGLAVLTAVSVTLFALDRDSACADPEPPARSGNAYVYHPGTGSGNCSLGEQARGGLYASVASGEYAGSLACGTYLAVAGPRGIVRVQVVDRCPGCRVGDLDLNSAAFARLTDRSTGTAKIAYRQIRDPAPSRALAFRVKSGSSRGWTAIQVLDHGNPISAVELRDGDGWRGLTRGSDNYWVTAEGVGRDRFDLRVRDVYGHRRTAAGLRLAPGKVQTTDVKLYGGPVRELAPLPTPLPSLSPERESRPRPRPPEPSPVTASRPLDRC